MLNIFLINAKRRCKSLIATFMPFIVIFMLLFLCVSCKTSQNSEGLIAPPTFPDSQPQATDDSSDNSLIKNTPRPTETAAPTNFPTPEPGMPDKLGLYIAENNERIFVDKFTSKWTVGKDIDCFEVLTSNEQSLHGKFGDLWKSSWANFSNTKNVKVGYKLEIHLLSGEIFSFDVKTPKDALQYKEYIEVYLYDDIHVSGWYSHLEEDDMEDETIITSIKLTATPKQNEINKIHLTAYLYTPDIPERSIISYSADVINDASKD